MCWPDAPAVSSPAARGPCGLPATAPQRQSGMEVAWVHPQYPPQVEVKEILWRLGQWATMLG